MNCAPAPAPAFPNHGTRPGPSPHPPPAPMPPPHPTDCIEYVPLEQASRGVKLTTLPGSQGYVSDRLPKTNALHKNCPPTGSKPRMRTPARTLPRTACRPHVLLFNDTNMRKSFTLGGGEHAVGCGVCGQTSPQLRCCLLGFQVATQPSPAPPCPAPGCCRPAGSRLLPPCPAPGCCTLAQAAATWLLPCPGFSHPAPATWLLLPCSSCCHLAAAGHPAHPAAPTLPQLLPGCCCHPAPATATRLLLCCHPAALLPPGSSAATRLLCCQPATWMLPPCPSFCHPAAATVLLLLPPGCALLPPCPCGCCKCRQPYHPCPTCCTATPAAGFHPAVLPPGCCRSPCPSLLPLCLLPSLLTRPRAIKHRDNTFSNQHTGLLS